jgi:acetyl esterase/lipase
MPFGIPTYHLLGLLNWLTPKAKGSRRVAAGLAYGPKPRQKLDVYAPTSGGGPWPLIVFFYGGSWDAGERGYFEFAGRALAAAGYVVAIPDYRLIPDVEYPAFLDDCMEATALAVSQAPHWGGDPSRLILAGHSAGAYNAAMLLLDRRYLDARGLAGAVKAFVSLSGPFDFYPFDIAVSIRAFAAASDPRATQPVNLVRPNLPPVWLGHGEADRLVGQRNSVALAKALRRGGNRVEERYYPDLNHPGTLLALGGPTTRKAPVLVDLLAFLKSVLAT